MRNTVLGLILLTSSAPALASDLVYEGTWVTTNRELDGTLTCVVTDLGGDKWRGNFNGEWQGMPFSYRVDFSGPREKLHGQAIIDGAFYEWTGEMDVEKGGSFKGKFSGSLYVGSFTLKKKDR